MLKPEQNLGETIGPRQVSAVETLEFAAGVCRLGKLPVNPKESSVDAITSSPPEPPTNSR